MVTACQQALRGALPNAQPGFVSLEGYLVGRTVLATLQEVDGKPTRAAVYLTVIGPDGKFRPITARP